LTLCYSPAHHRQTGNASTTNCASEETVCIYDIYFSSQTIYTKNLSHNINICSYLFMLMMLICWGDINIRNNNAEILLQASKEICLEVNIDKSKCMFWSKNLTRQ
jgi:hypothetical protein